MKFLLSLSVVILSLACSNGDSNANNSDKFEAFRVEDAVAETVMSSKQVLSAQNSNRTIQQKLIKESYLNFETQDLDKTYIYITSIIKQNGGFIQDDNSNKSYNRISRHLVVRLPSVEFQKTIDSISRN